MSDWIMAKFLQAQAQFEIMSLGILRIRKLRKSFLIEFIAISILYLFLLSSFLHRGKLVLVVGSSTLMALVVVLTLVATYVHGLLSLKELETDPRESLDSEVLR